MLNAINIHIIGEFLRIWREMAKLRKLLIATALLAFIQPPPAYGQDNQSLLKVRVGHCDSLVRLFKYQEAIDCLRPLADAGLVDATSRLMNIYYEGKAVTPDYVSAAKYAAIGAAADDVRSLAMLAVLKSVGLGTAKNWEEALRLRRRVAQLERLTQEPQRVAGNFSGHADQVRETERIVANVLVGSNGVIKNCVAEGLSEDLKSLTCRVIIKYFTFLPAVDANGIEIDRTWTNPINFTAPPKYVRISNIIPGKVLSGEILASDFTRYKIRRTGLQKLKLEVNLLPTGLVQGCIVKSSERVLGTYACKIVKEKFKFTPATLPSGVKKASKLDLELDIDFPVASALPNVPLAQPQNVSPPPPISNTEVTAPVQKTAGPTSETGDVTLDTALNRCDRIGFKRDTSEFRGCVTEQIRLLSK